MRSRDRGFTNHSSPEAVSVEHPGLHLHLLRLEHLAAAPRTAATLEVISGASTSRDISIQKCNKLVILACGITCYISTIYCAPAWRGSWRCRWRRGRGWAVWPRGRGSGGSTAGRGGGGRSSGPARGHTHCTCGTQRGTLIRLKIFS